MEPERSTNKLRGFSQRKPNQTKRVGSTPLLSRRKNPISTARSRNGFANLTPSSSRIQNELAVSPQVAAMVVRQYLLPLFESENKQTPKHRNILQGLPSLREQLNRPLQVVSNTVYGQLKLADTLLTEYTQAKAQLDVVSQKLKDTEQEREYVLSQLEHLKAQYSEVTLQIQSLQSNFQQSIRNQQYTDLALSLQNNQLSEYKKLFAQSEMENKQFLSDLHQEKAQNDKRRNISAQLDHGNELLRMENDIMAEKLTGLYEQFKTLSERRFLQQKLISQTDTLAFSLEKLAIFCNDLSKQLTVALSQREQLKSQHDQIEVLTQQIKAVRDRLLNYSRQAINNLQKQLTGMVQQRQQYKSKLAKLEKNYKDLADAYQKLRARLKQWKQRGRQYKDHQQKICSKCRQAYAQRENFNWSCKTHAGTYSANSDVWWCCGKYGKDAQGCIPSKHISKEEDQEDEIAQTKADQKLNLFSLVCSSCKEIGHKPHECPKDPNIRTVVDPTQDDQRIQDIRQRKKANFNNIDVNSKLMGILEAKFGGLGFGEQGSDWSEDEEDNEFPDILRVKKEVKEEKKREERQQMMCFKKAFLKTGFCAVWVLMILTMGAASILIISIGVQDHRSELISEYKDKLQQWDQTKQDFQRVSVQVEVEENQEIYYVELLPTFKDPWLIKSDPYQQLPQYEPFFFQQTVTAQLVGLNDTQKFDKDFQVCLLIRITQNNQTFFVPLPSIPQIRITKTKDLLRSTCEQLEGFYDIQSAKCWRFFKLKGACAKLDKKFELDYSGGSAGCYGNRNELGIYGQIKASLTKPEPHKLPVQFEQFLVQVRSGDDPVIQARIITQNSLNFDLPASGWFAMGFTTLFLSVFLIIQPIIFFWKKRKGSDEARLFEIKEDMQSIPNK